MISSGTTVELGEEVLAGAVERRIGDLFEQRVRLAIDHAVPLVDRGAAEGLREMTLAGARRAREKGILALQDEAAVARSWIRRGSSSC